MKKAVCIGLCALLALLFACGYQNSQNFASGSEPQGAVLPSSRFFYDTLDETEKICYLIMFEALQDTQERRVIKGTRADTAQKAYAALLADHPEIYWARDYWYGENGADLVFQPEYLFTDSEKVTAQTRMTEALKELEQGLDGLDDYEKALTLFARTVQWVEYDETAQNGQTLYGALLERRAVCAGYARLYQYLLCRQKIAVIYIEGTMRDGIRHAWVEACLDGEWAYFDPTSAEPDETPPGCTPPPCRYAFFGMTDADLAALGYRADGEPALPAAVSFANTYYSRTGDLLSDYDRTEMEKRISAAVRRGESTVPLRFLDEAGARTAVEDLFGPEQGILIILAQLKEHFPALISDRAYYTFYPELGCMDLYLLREK